jgi:thiol-disulfide isomerase/thioredoxin
MPNPLRFLENKDFDMYGNILPNLPRTKSVVLFYSDGCPACRKFKPTFEQLQSIDNLNANVLLVPVNNNPVIMERMRKSWPFTVPFIPTVVSYDNGTYYSTYNYGQGDNNKYRTLPDLIEYVRGIGSAPIQYM